MYVGNTLYAELFNTKQSKQARYHEYCIKYKATKLSELLKREKLDPQKIQTVRYIKYKLQNLHICNINH